LPIPTASTTSAATTIAESVIIASNQPNGRGPTPVHRRSPTGIHLPGGP
jgi:hypothetical protein